VKRFVALVQWRTCRRIADLLGQPRSRRVLGQGRYADGVVRLYRAVEMWHQWRLVEHHSVSTKGVRWEEIPEGAKVKFLEESRLAQLPEDLALTRARMLDRILSGEAVEDDNVFRDLLQKRNNSILAHGLKPVGEGSARKFLEYVDVMINRPEIGASAEYSRLREL
jgi:hypothetical protein